jgi:PAS domain S-box-containing protein
MINKSPAKTKEQLISENEDLYSRLAEVEDTLAAIRNGDVDAILVPGDNGEQVYSISSAETPYRTFVEEMHAGAVTITKDGIVLYSNNRFAELVHEPVEHVIGSNLKRYITQNDNSKFDHFISHLTHGKHDVLIVSLTNTMYLRLSIHKLPPYLQGDNYILIATDITDLKKRENELREIIGMLAGHIKMLRELRIENICDNLDTEGRKNRLEIANTKLYKEITNLKRLVAELKQKEKEPISKIS